MATRVLQGICIFEVFCKCITQGSFLWSFIEIYWLVSEEKISVSNCSRTDGHTDGQWSITIAHPEHIVLRWANNQFIFVKIESTTFCRQTKRCCSKIEICLSEYDKGRGKRRTYWLLAYIQIENISRRQNISYNVFCPFKDRFYPLRKN